MTEHTSFAGFGDFAAAGHGMHFTLLLIEKIGSNECPSIVAIPAGKSARSEFELVKSPIFSTEAGGFRVEGFDLNVPKRSEFHEARAAFSGDEDYSD